MTDYQVIVETIANTRTGTGLTVTAVLDTNTYPTGIKVSKAELAAVPLSPQPFHGEWNYIVHPGLSEKPLPSKRARSKRTE